jgi:hypothetical protein
MEHNLCNSIAGSAMNQDSVSGLLPISNLFYKDKNKNKYKTKFIKRVYSEDSICKSDSDGQSENEYPSDSDINSELTLSPKIKPQPKYKYPHKTDAKIINIKINICSCNILQMFKNMFKKL